MAVIQWNINGLIKHLPELQSLIAFTDPYFICLQESHLKGNQQPRINGYTSYRKDRINEQHASGGVAIFAKYSILSEEIIIRSDMEVVAIKTYNPEIMTICNIYIYDQTYH